MFVMILTVGKITVKQIGYVLYFLSVGAIHFSMCY